MTIDEQKLDAFVHQAVADMGVAVSGALVHIGDKLGLYKAMAGAGPLTPPSSPRAPAPPSGMSASGSTTRPQAATSLTTRPPPATSCPTSTRMVSADENSPVFLLRRRSKC